MTTDSARLYESTLACMFEPFARHMAEASKVSAEEVAVDIACGTGFLARALSEWAPNRVTGLDVSPAMIREARTHCSKADWVIGDMTRLPFRFRSVDQVFCQFGIMFAREPLGPFSEARRVLRQGGSYHVAVWGSLDVNPVPALVHRTVRSLTGRTPDLERPFSMSSEANLRTCLHEAGFARVEFHRARLELCHDDASMLARGLIGGNPLGSALLRLGHKDLTPFVKAISLELTREFGNSVRAPMEALFIHAS